MGNGALQALLAAEREGDLWNQRVLGQAPWALERLRRYRFGLLDGALDERTGAGVPWRRRFAQEREPLVRSLRDLARTPRLPRGRDVWVLSLSSYRRKDAQGATPCIFTRDIEEQFGARVLFLERDTTGLPVARSEGIRHIDAIHLAAMTAAKLFAPWAVQAGAVSEAQARAFHPLAPTDVCRLALYGRFMAGAVEHWIRAARPRAVFVLCGYQPFIPIQRVVRAHGIPLIELQHGLIHPSHPGYVFDEGVDPDHLPDHIVLFGGYFGDMLDRESPRWRGRWTVGGHRWLAEAASRITRPAAERSDVVFFSQTDEPVRKSIAEAVRSWAPRLPPGLRILIKPHPRETDARAYWAPIEGPRVSIASHLDDSYALLTAARMSVAVYSTVAVEALAFGCPSVVLRSPLWSDDIRVLVERGVLRAASSEDDPSALLAASTRDRSGEDLSDRLFGVRTPSVDFERLIVEVDATRRSRA